MTFNNALKWLATAVTIAGALAVVHSLDPLNIYLFNAGSVLWVIWAIRIKEPSILVVNLAMMGVYLYGLFLRY